MEAHFQNGVDNLSWLPHVARCHKKIYTLYVSRDGIHHGPVIEWVIINMYSKLIYRRYRSLTPIHSFSPYMYYLTNIIYDRKYYMKQKLKKTNKNDQMIWAVNSHSNFLCSYFLYNKKDKWQKKELVLWLLSKASF